MAVSILYRNTPELVSIPSEKKLFLENKDLILNLFLFKKKFKLDL
jgi:hypothetical protein